MNFNHSTPCLTPDCWSLQQSMTILVAHVSNLTMSTACIVDEIPESSLLLASSDQLLHEWLTDSITSDWAFEPARCVHQVNLGTWQTWHNAQSHVSPDTISFHNNVYFFLVNALSFFAFSRDNVVDYQRWVKMHGHATFGDYVRKFNYLICPGVHAHAVLGMNSTYNRYAWTCVCIDGCIFWATWQTASNFTAYFACVKAFKCICYLCHSVWCVQKVGIMQLVLTYLPRCHALYTGFRIIHSVL